MLSDLDAREASLKTREAMLTAREHEVSTKEADADARSRQAASKARNAEMLVSMAEKLIDRFIGNAIERFAAKLESLASAAEKAAGDRPQQRGLWRTVSDAAGAIARHVHEHAGGETMKEWAGADVVALYGPAPDRQHEFVADLWSYADVSAQRGRTAGDGAESWLGQARHANTLADILNRIGDPVIDGGSMATSSCSSASKARAREPPERRKLRSRNPMPTPPRHRAPARAHPITMGRHPASNRGSCEKKRPPPPWWRAFLRPFALRQVARPAQCVNGRGFDLELRKPLIDPRADALDVLGDVRRDEGAFHHATNRIPLRQVQALVRPALIPGGFIHRPGSRNGCQKDR